MVGMVLGELKTLKILKAIEVYKSRVFRLGIIYNDFFIYVMDSNLNQHIMFFIFY